eukprot:scaffold1638_cov27-Phaeocystis_antarctica.AAC.1
MATTSLAISLTTRLPGEGVGVALELQAGGGAPLDEDEVLLELLQLGLARLAPGAGEGSMVRGGGIVRGGYPLPCHFCTRGHG